MNAVLPRPAYVKPDDGNEAAEDDPPECGSEKDSDDEQRPRRDTASRHVQTGEERSEGDESHRVG